MAPIVYQILLIASTSSLLKSGTKKYYEIPQNHIGNTEHMCYNSNIVDVTKDTIRNWIKKTDIPAHKIGKLWKFKRIELDAWVKSGRSAIE